MNHCPEELKYAASHEWARVNTDGSVTIGITDHAQEALGDLVYVEVPEVDSHFGASDAFGVVESVKAASDVYLPISGTILEVNEALEDGPELVNDSAYDEGWLVRIQPDDETELDTLMDSAAYADAIAD